LILIHSTATLLSIDLLNTLHASERENKLTE
jgi:hypothetical protein